MADDTNSKPGRTADDTKGGVAVAVSTAKTINIVKGK
jgi:hypothetical protein